MITYTVVFQTASALTTCGHKHRTLQAAEMCLTSKGNSVGGKVQQNMAEGYSDSNLDDIP